MPGTTVHQPGQVRELAVAFDQLLEITWSEHQALVAQLRRILSMEQRLLDLCRCAGLDVPKTSEAPDLPDMKAVPGGDPSSTTLHGRWEGAFSFDP